LRAIRGTNSFIFALGGCGHPPGENGNAVDDNIHGERDFQLRVWTIQKQGHILFHADRDVSPFLILNKIRHFQEQYFS
jgi:hypothetical protein